VNLVHLQGQAQGYSYLCSRLCCRWYSTSPHLCYPERRVCRRMTGALVPLRHPSTTPTPNTPVPPTQCSASYSPSFMRRRVRNRTARSSECLDVCIGHRAFTLVLATFTHHANRCHRSSMAQSSPCRPLRQVYRTGTALLESLPLHSSAPSAHPMGSSPRCTLPLTIPSLFFCVSSATPLESVPSSKFSFILVGHRLRQSHTLSSTKDRAPGATLERSPPFPTAALSLLTATHAAATLQCVRFRTAFLHLYTHLSSSLSFVHQRQSLVMFCA